MADPDVADMFAGLKKKKKKVTLLDAPSTTSTTTSGSNGDTLHESVKETGTVDPVRPVEKDADLTLKDDEPLDFSNLKKKKKNKEVAIDLEEVATPSDGKVIDRLGSTDAVGNTIAAGASAEPATDVLEEFSGLKKKKKSKKSAFDLEAFEKELAAVEGGAPASGDGTPAAGSDDEADGEAREVPAPDGENPFGEGQDASTDGKSKAEMAADKKAWLQDPSRDYTYQELLGRFYTLLFAGNPTLSREGGKKRYTIVPPNVQREGSKRTSFANIAEICKKLRRQPEHVIQFMFAELGTSGSVDGSGRLIIKGRFQQKQIENVLRRYIVEYVNCKTCKLPDTLLTKDNRLYFVTCETCGSKQSVASIKVGFQAQTKRRPKAA